jgi:hypothetical protein
MPELEIFLAKPLASLPGTRAHPFFHIKIKSERLS